MKTCYLCQTSKDYDLFFKDRTKPDGHSSKCKECAIRRKRELYAENPEPYRKVRKEWEKRNPDYEKKWRDSRPWYTSQKRAEMTSRKLGREYEDYETILNYLMSFEQKCMTPDCGDTTRLSMDHIIPFSRGGSHVRDNIQILCGSCNSRKAGKIKDYTWKQYGIGYTYEGEEE